MHRQFFSSTHVKKINVLLSYRNFHSTKKKGNDSLSALVNNVKEITKKIAKERPKLPSHQAITDKTNERIISDEMSGEEILGELSKDTDLIDNLKERKRVKVERIKSTPSQKQFLGIREPADNIIHREYLPPVQPENPRSISVAIVGRPNAGKSSVLHRMLGAKVSAISRKFNTTRDRVLGILTKGDVQMAFYDTPGLVDETERHRYVRPLVTAASDTVYGTDVTMLVVDSVKHFDKESRIAISSLVKQAIIAESPIMLVLNKIDLAQYSHERLVGKLEDLIYTVWTEETGLGEDEYKKVARAGQEFYPVSAKYNKGIDKIVEDLDSKAEECPWSHHASVKSDLSDLDLVTELIREKIFWRINSEIPYLITQQNRGWTYFNDGSLRIDQDIFVPHTRLKKLVIGHNGDTIRTIGCNASDDISKLLGCRVHLYLHIRARK